MSIYAVSVFALPSVCSLIKSPKPGASLRMFIFFPPALALTNVKLPSIPLQPPVTLQPPPSG